MKEILITVSKKIATTKDSDYIVNGNSDLTARFVFDSEWDNTGTKTAVFVLSDGSAYYKPLVDDTCQIPVLYNTSFVKIGVISAAVCTSTSATVKCYPCVADEARGEAPITQDLYAELCAYIDKVCFINNFPISIGENGNWYVGDTDTGKSAIGEKGEKGDSYSLTDSDKVDIAEQVEGVNVVKVPKFVSSVEEMTDPDLLYVHALTGTIWAYMNTTCKATFTDVIESTADNPHHAGTYVNKDALSSKSDSFVTPFIDLTKYSGTIKLIVKGATCLSETATVYNQMAFHKADETYIDRCYMSLAAQSGAYVVTQMVDMLEQVIVDGDTAIFEIALPRCFTTTLIEKIRFGCVGTWESSEISIEYNTTVTGNKWLDTGIPYAPTVTETEKQEIADDVISRIDTELLAVVGTGEVV